MTVGGRHVMPHAGAAAAGLLLDAALGEPPPGVHPVSAFGRAMRRLEHAHYGPSRARGTVFAAAGLGLGLGAGWLAASTPLCTAMSVGARALWALAGDVGEALSTGDLDRARALLPGLVGRDPDVLDVKEMARAAVESVAENTVDAIVAPALWAALLGAPGACLQRAADTLDSMVGYRSARYEQFGWASARADDVVEWLPARLCAGLVALVRPRSAADVVRCVRFQAPAHPSPNAGVAEAAFAAALGVRLGGTNRYGGRLELRATLGTGRPPEPADVAGAVRLSRHVWAALVGGLVVVAASQRRRVRQ